MTRNEMITLLRSVGCDENTVTAMSNAYEMGFEQGAKGAEILTRLIDIARPLMHPDEHEFWDEFYKLETLQ